MLDKQIKTSPNKLEKQIKKELTDKNTEINTICNASNILGHSLNYHQIIRTITNYINNVIKYDICTIFINTSQSSADLFSIINSPIENHLIKNVQEKTLKSLSKISHPLNNKKKINYYTYNNHTTSNVINKTNQFNSLLSFPLVFKNDIIGLYQIYSNQKNAFPKKKLPFLNIMINQLTTNIGRLKVIKKLEKTKLYSLIHSITDGILMLNQNYKSISINTTATNLLNLNNNDSNNPLKIIQALKKNNILSLYQKVITTKKPIFNQKLSLKNQYFSLNITPIINENTKHPITIFVFRDITEMQKIDLIKTQRLKIIAKTNEIINSISNLDKLLTVLIQFILKITSTQIGSIQLKKEKKFETIANINFSKKTQEKYKLKNNNLISSLTIKKKKITYIENFNQNKLVQKIPNEKINSYICAPILVNKKLIGLINIVQKQKTNEKLSPENLLTLKIITKISGTAIQNALNYNETLNQQRIKEELSVCKKIQQNLLPQKKPKLKHIEFSSLNLPAKEIGGDYHDFIQFKNGKIGIIIADIVGKGLPAGIFMAMLKTLLITQADEKKTPGKTLNQLNKILITHPIINKFVPLFYSILDPQKLILTYSNAGHEAPLWYSQKKIQPLNSKNTPLGTELNKKYITKKIKLQKNDLLLFFTDGVTETKNKSNIPFGIKKIKKTVINYAQKNAQEITDQLNVQLKKHNDTKKNHDDLTIVTIKILENAP